GFGPSCPPDALQSNGTPCDDGNACTRTDRCSFGACTGTDPVTCTALDGCHLVGSCTPATGTCSNPTKPDNVSCNDGHVCTLLACRTGDCEHQSDNSGPRCPVLVTPYRTAVSLLARTRELEATLRAATATACDRIGTGCDVAASSDADRLVALLVSADGELG